MGNNFISPSDTFTHFLASSIFYKPALCLPSDRSLLASICSSKLLSM